jgi:hypothetical protein
MVPIRRWRPWAVVIGIWVIGAWFFLRDGASSSYRGTGSLFQPKVHPVHPFKGQSKANDGKVHWSKLPDRYPVSTLRALPTGKPETKIPKIQLYPPPAEDKAARQVRETRLAAVKESFVHSWTGYKQNAWLHDEVTPLTGEKHNPFGGWAATLVDALDTLWIMGLKDEFAAAVKACEKIDFTITETTAINVFETTIRYLGGFLAAFELSGGKYPTLLDKAAEVGELLMCAFDTPNHMPISRWPWEE